MALEATHVRFAEQILSPIFPAGIPAESFSGAVYPDSRYVTSVTREATHGLGAPMDPLAPDLSPFKRGWASHLRYDELAHPAYRSFLRKSKNEIAPLSEEWLTVTAVKIVEDRLSYAALKDPTVFQDLPLSAPRSGESIELLEKYYAAIQKFYSTPRSIDDYLDVLTQFGIPKQFAEQIIVKTKELTADPIALQTISSIFPKPNPAL